MDLAFAVDEVSGLKPRFLAEDLVDGAEFGGPLGLGMLMLTASTVLSLLLEEVMVSLTILDKSSSKSIGTKFPFASRSPAGLRERRGGI